VYASIYIEQNTKHRARKDATEFEKRFSKLLNNGIYRETLEYIFARVDFCLAKNKKSLKKKVSKPNFENVCIFHENLVGVHMKKPKLFSANRFFSVRRFWIYQRS